MYLLRKVQDNVTKSQQLSILKTKSTKPNNKYKWKNPSCPTKSKPWHTNQTQNIHINIKISQQFRKPNKANRSHSYEQIRTKKYWWKEEMKNYTPFVPYIRNTFVEQLLRKTLFFSYFPIVLPKNIIVVACLDSIN